VNDEVFLAMSKALNFINPDGDFQHGGAHRARTASAGRGWFEDGLPGWQPHPSAYASRWWTTSAPGAARCMLDSPLREIELNDDGTRGILPHRRHQRPGAAHSRAPMPTSAPCRWTPFKLLLPEALEAAALFPEARRPQWCPR
jgi:hypothetical protein